MRRRVQHGQVGPGPHLDAADVAAPQRHRGPGGRGIHRLPRGHAHLPHGERDDEGHRRRVAGARVAVGRQRDRAAGVEQAPRVGVGRAGRELDARQERGHGGARRVRPAPRRRLGQVGAVVDAGRPELDSELHAGPGPSWLPCTRSPSPASRPATRTARASSSVKAWDECGSQKTSIHRAYGAAASSIGPVTSSRYAARSPAYSAGTTWAPRKVVSGVNSRGDAQRPRLVVDGQAVAALDLHGGRALGAHLGDPARERARAARRRVAARVAATETADATAVVALTGHARGELVARGRRRRRGGRGSRRSRAAPPGRRGRPGGRPRERCDAGPTQRDPSLLRPPGRRRGAAPGGRSWCRHR